MVRIIIALFTVIVN